MKSDTYIEKEKCAMMPMWLEQQFEFNPIGCNLWKMCLILWEPIRFRERMYAANIKEMFARAYGISESEGPVSGSPFCWQMALGEWNYQMEKDMFPKVLWLAGGIKGLKLSNGEGPISESPVCVCAPGLKLSDRERPVSKSPSVCRQWSGTKTVRSRKACV